MNAVGMQVDKKMVTIHYLRTSMETLSINHKGATGRFLELRTRLIETMRTRTVESSRERQRGVSGSGSGESGE